MHHQASGKDEKLDLGPFGIHRPETKQKENRSKSETDIRAYPKVSTTVRAALAGIVTVRSRTTTTTSTHGSKTTVETKVKTTAARPHTA